MKAKKYTNSSWTEGDYEKEYSTATDTYTTLPAEFQTSGADVENYQVYGKTVENVYKFYGNGYYSFIDGTTWFSDNNWQCSDLIPVTGGETLTFCYTTNDDDFKLYWYNSATSLGSYSSGGSPDTGKLTMTLTVPNQVNYFRIAIPATATEVMLTKGSTAPTRYVPYGTPDGVGEETENLFNISEYPIGTTTFPAKMLTLEPNTAYTMSSDAPTYNYGALIVLIAVGETATTANNGVYNGHPITKTTDANGHIYVGLRNNGSGYDLSTYKTMLVKGSTAPTTFIPFGYKIPILNTSGVTENLVPEISTANGWRQGYLNIDGTYNPAHSRGEWLSPLVEIRSATSISIAYKPVSSGASQSMYYFDSNGNYISNKGLSTNGHATFTNFPEGTAQVCYAFRTYCLTEEEIVENEMWTCLVKGDIPPDHYIPHRYESNYDLFIGDSKLYEDEYLNYGEQKVYKLKEVHKDTVTIDGVVWDILGYDHDEVYDGEGNLAQHSVTIQTHDCIANLQFDEREALFAFPSGLSAGTYHFSVTQSLYSGDVGKTMQFTLMNNIPADGVIVLSNIYNVTMIGSTISIYASPSATTAGETATISEGSDGTDLGSVGNAISGNTNSIQRALLGNNNYNQSAIRQFLNADGAAGTYWTPQNKWDRPPRWNASQAGFLNGFSSNFKNAIGTSKKVTALNTVCDGGGTETTNEKVFLLSQTEAYCGGNEGTAYNYYSDYSDLSAAGTEEDDNRIKYQNNVVKSWCTRSANILHASYGRVISKEGAFVGFTVNNDTTTSPAVCIPLDNISNDPYLQSLFLKPVDPPLPFPTLTTYLGENSIDVDTTVQPEKVALNVAAWREKEGKEYNGGSWS